MDVNERPGGLNELRDFTFDKSNSCGCLNEGMCMFTKDLITFCHCPKYYAGEQCQDAVPWAAVGSDPNSGDQSFSPATFGYILFAAVIVIVVSMLAWRKYRSSKQKVGHQRQETVDATSAQDKLTNQSQILGKSGRSSAISIDVSGATDNLAHIPCFKII